MVATSVTAGAGAGIVEGAALHEEIEKALKASVAGGRVVVNVEHDIQGMLSTCAYTCIMKSVSECFRVCPPPPTPSLDIP